MLAVTAGPPYAGRVVHEHSSLKIRSKSIDFLFFIWSEEELPKRHSGPCHAGQSDGLHGGLS